MRYRKRFVHVYLVQLHLAEIRILKIIQPVNGGRSVSAGLDKHAGA